MELVNEEIADIQKFKEQLCKVVIENIKTRVVRIMIGQYSIGDNSLNLHIFTEYIENAENLEFHSPDVSSRDKKLLANQFISFTNSVRDSIKSDVSILHRFDKLTVDLYFNPNKNENAMSYYGELIGDYTSNNETIL